MKGERRREGIIELLCKSAGPVSGETLAARFGVSRQVIVQDIALLKAVNSGILSTNRGYLLLSGGTDGRVRRVVKVKHGDAQILDELNGIVDLGGKVLDVSVEHEIYGKITAPLIIASRADAAAFVRKVGESGTQPLNKLTDGVHYHTVEADSEQVLEAVERQLMEKGYLQS